MTWAQPSVTTDIHYEYKPELTTIEKNALFYTEKETRRFRRKVKKVAAMEKALAKQKTTLSQSSTCSMVNSQQTTSVSEVITMATAYLSKLAISLETSTTSTSRSSDNTDSERTNALIETLYLF